MAASFVQAFNRLKIIHCMCPHCKGIVRVSDLQLRSRGKAERTWLDVYDAKERRLGKKERAFGEREEELKRQAIDRGRRQVPGLISRSIDRNFLRLGYDPYDVKAILHPIDFVAFRGMNAGQVEDITLLSRKAASPRLSSAHKAIADAVRGGSYDWKVLRVSQDGQVDCH